jgi:hypothetical protein
MKLPDDVSSTAIQHVCRLKIEKSGEESMALDLCRLLLNAGASGLDPLIEKVGNHGHYYLHWFRGSPALFQFLQHQMYPPYQVLPMKARLDILETISYEQNKHGPDIFRLVLGNTALTEDMLTSKDFWGWTALHYIALALSETKCTWTRPCFIWPHSLEYFSQHINCYNGHQTGWSKLLRDVIAAGSPLHATSYSRRTPLCVLLCEFWKLPLKTKPWRCDATRIQLLSCTLHNWLYDLQLAGVDLEQYGQQETILGLVSTVNSCRRLECGAEKFHLIGVSYGARLEDWKFWFSEPTDYLIGKFWNMVEDSHGNGDLLFLDSQYPIPGSWMECNEFLESDSDSEYGVWEKF